MTADLAEFLLARLLDDLAAGLAEHKGAAALRVLQNCATTARLVETARYCSQHRGDTGENAFDRALAAPYADHPDYRQEWRP